MLRIEDFYSTNAAFSVLVTFLILYIAICVFRKKASPYPPGPPALPFVGNLLFFTKNPHQKLLELRKKYGPVFSLRLGSNKLVVLCDYKVIRNALFQDAFLGVPPNMQESNNTETPDPAKLAAEWTEQRRSLIHILKDVGFGKSKMEEYLREEIFYVLKVIEDQVGQPVAMKPILHPSVSNNIASLILGRRMSYDDPKSILLNQLLKDFNKFFGQLAVAAYFPWMQTVMRCLHIGSLHKLQDITVKMSKFFHEEIEEHEKTLDPENIRDFIDGFLVQTEKRKGEPNSKFTRGFLQETAQGLFAAGTDTVRFTIDWLLLTMAAFSDVQHRVQTEIDDVIGSERFPLYKDLSTMPYTHAVILEIMRWRNVFPLNYFKYTIKDAEVNSVLVPKNTNVLINTWSISHDATLWGHPDSFRPERFLTDDGKSIRKPEFFIPFSIGKRVCPGESFATMETFLYFTAILQKFNISPPDGVAIDLEGELGLSLQPKAQKIVFIRRH